jgi:hypothetical protein
MPLQLDDLGACPSAGSTLGPSFSSIKDLENSASFVLLWSTDVKSGSGPGR